MGRYILFFLALGYILIVALGFNNWYDDSETHQGRIIVSSFAVLFVLAFVSLEKFNKDRGLKIFSMLITSLGACALTSIVCFVCEPVYNIVKVKGYHVASNINRFPPCWCWDKSEYLSLADLDSEYFIVVETPKTGKIEVGIKWPLQYAKGENILYLQRMYPPDKKISKHLYKDRARIVQQIVEKEIKKLGIKPVTGKPVRYLLNRVPKEEIRTVVCINDSELKALQTRIANKLNKAIPKGLEAAAKPSFLGLAHEKNADGYLTGELIWAD